MGYRITVSNPFSRNKILNALMGVWQWVGSSVSFGNSSIVEVTSLSAYAVVDITAPYSATILPLKGVVPVGYTIRSDTDTNLRASILSTHDDGSAAVVVVSGNMHFNSGYNTINLQVSAYSDSASILPTQVSSLLSSITVDFGSTYGVASITDFTTPETTWWSNSNNACFRYRIQPTAPGTTALECVIDVHYWNDRARVDIVVENCKMNSSSPTAPQAASYTNAIVQINGNTITTVNGNSAPEGSHYRFRAWYATGWVGTNPQLTVTQIHTDLQKHPLLFKPAAPSSVDMSQYSGDAYSPWSTGRHRADSMAAGGDHYSIGPLPLWECHTLNTGDYRGWKAVEASSLALLGYAIQYRDTTTGKPPTIDQLSGKSLQYNWPGDDSRYGPMAWEVAHCPDAGFMAFIGRPSPIFIEIAQKSAVFNAVWSQYADGGPSYSTGVFGTVYQMRAKAWGMRNLAHATFLSPNGSSWKDSGQASIIANIAWFDAYRTDSKQTDLAIMWDNRPGYPTAANNNTTRPNMKLWQYAYFLVEMAKIAEAKLVDSSDQIIIDRFVNWALLHPIRWILDQATTGAWRYVPEMLVLGQDGVSAPTMLNSNTYDAQRATWMIDSPPVSPSGIWYGPVYDGNNSYYSNWANDTSLGVSRASYFWPALCAAVDRKVAGYAEAWWIVQRDLTNLSSWLNGAGSDPRWGATIRTTPPPFGFAEGTDTGTVVGDVWTPAKTAGVVNAASWDIVPSNRWVTIAGSNISALQAQIVEQIPLWANFPHNTYWDTWVGSWSGICTDENGARFWRMGGGHSNGSNNGLYRFDCFKMSWDIENMPSDPATWPSSYLELAPTGSVGTANPEASNLYWEKLAANTLTPINDVYYDYFLADQKPTGRHMYESMVYIPETNELIMNCRRLWRYSLSSHDWTQRRLYLDLLNVAEIGGYLDAENVIAIYDEVNHKLMTTSLGSNYGGNGRYIEYRTDVNEWNGGSSTGKNAPWQRNANCSARNGRMVYFIGPPTSPRNSYSGGDGWWQSYNLDTGVVVQSAVDANTPGTGFQYAGGLSRSSFVPYDYWFDGSGACFVPPLNRIWLQHMDSAGTVKIYEVDHTTSPWTISPGPTLGNQPSIMPYAKRAMMWIPSMNAVVCSGHGTQPSSIFKF